MGRASGAPAGDIEPPSQPSGEPPPAPTLRALIERLQPALLEVVSAPRGLDVPVSDPLLLDVSEPLPPADGVVVLALGVDSDRGRVSVVRQAADAGAVAVVVKLPGAAGDDLRAAAEDAGLLHPDEAAVLYLQQRLFCHEVRRRLRMPRLH